MDSDSTTIATALRQVRRRSVLALAAGNCAAAGAFAAIALAAVALLGPAEPPWGSLLALAAAAGLALSAVATWLRVPSLEEVARRLDRLGNLRQGLETAVELLHVEDEVARAIRGQARRQLRAADSIPLRSPAERRRIRRAVGLSALAAIAAVALRWWAPALGVGGREGLLRPVATAASPSEEAAAAPDGRLERREATARADQRPTGEAGSESELEGELSPDPPAADGLPRAGPGTRAPPSPTRDPRRREPAGLVGRAGLAEPAEPSAPRVSPRAGAPPAATADGAVPADADLDRRPTAGAGADEVPLEPPEERSGAASAAADGGLPGGAGRARPAAGGGAAETADGPRSFVPAGAAGEAERPGGRPTGWTAVDRALAEADIPPALERYVRDYFIAIRPRE